MNVTLNLPPDVEQGMLAEAQSRGLSLDELVSEVVIARTQTRQHTSSPRASRLWIFGRISDWATSRSGN